MMRVPEHVMKAHEDTDTALVRLRAVIVGAMQCDEAAPREHPTTPEADAVISLLMLALEKLEEIHRLQLREWVAAGGNSETLTPDEIAQARGEK